jgi:hypothetical protein
MKFLHVAKISRKGAKVAKFLFVSLREPFEFWLGRVSALPMKFLHVE